MSNILVVDTSYMTGFSLILISSGEFLSLSSLSNEPKFGIIWGMLDTIFSSSEVKKEDIDCLGVSKGPGPFSSIRTGMTIAKTLREIKKVPVVTFSTFEVLSSNFDNAYFFVDGRAKKFIVYGSDLEEVKIISASQLEQFVNESRESNKDAKFVAVSCQNIIANLVKERVIHGSFLNDFIFYDVLPHSWIKDLVLRKYELKDFDDNLEPFYIHQHLVFNSI